jgi:hypothetical protein
MKHLKMFEGFDDPYYWRITESEYDTIEPEEFSDGLQAKLDSILINGWELYHRPSSFMITLYNENGERDWRVGKGGDEWFFADTTNVDEEWNEEWKYYRCDQWEGLLKLLEDQGIVKS